MLRKTAMMVLTLALGAEDALAKHDFSWLEGCWQRVDGEKVSVELWIAASDDLLLALNYGVGDDRTTFEYLRIDQATTAPRYVAQPGGAAPVAFPLAASTATSAAFLKSDHDYPQRITYLREDNELTATISLADGSDAYSWTWGRVSCDAL